MANDKTGYKRLVTLGDTIVGEDLTNGWTKVAVANSPFKKVATAGLFSSTTITASGTTDGTWIDVDGYTRFAFWIDINDGGGAGTCTCTVTMIMRPAAATSLQQNILTVTGVTNKTLLTNVTVDNTDAAGVWADEIKFTVTETAGADGTISAAYLFCAA